MAKAINYGFEGDAARALQAWPRDCGPRVTQAQLDAAAGVLKRHGTGKHLALAMYLRDGGATQNMVFACTGDTQVNVSRDLIAAGLARAVDMPGTGRRKVYKLALGKPAKPASKPATGKATAGKATPASKASKPATGKRKATAGKPASKPAKPATAGKATPAVTPAA